MALAESLEWGWTAGEAVYRGPDRRRASVPARLRTTSFPFGAYLVGTHVVLVAALVLGGSAASTRDQTDWLTPSVAVISALAAGISAVRWRLVGDAAALWVAAALLVYAATNVAFPELLGTFADSGVDATAFTAMRPSSVIVVMTLLLVAALSPRVDATMTPRRVLAWTACFAGVAVIASHASLDVRLLFGPAIDEAPSQGTTALGQIGVGCLWLALAVVFLCRAKRNWAGIDAWLALMLMGLAEARLALAMSVNGDPAWLIASQVGRLLGVVAVLVGVLNELDLSFIRQRSTLLVTDAELSSTRARHEAALATAEERAHDLRSALAGIGTAAVTLERYHDHLSADEQAGLARAVAAEIARLQQIVSDVRPAPVVCALATVLEPLLVCAGSGAEDLTAAVPPDLSARARPTEVVEIVRLLLDNARRHGAAPFAITGRRQGSRVEIRVADRGEGIAFEHRDAIFERGWRGATSTEGSGLGLYSARRLAREQGGDLWFEDGPGGSSFVLALPMAAEGGETHGARD